MFKTPKHILAAVVVVAAVARPSSALADTPTSSGSAPTVSQIVITKTVNPPTPKVVQTSVPGTYTAPARQVTIDETPAS